MMRWIARLLLLALAVPATAQSLYTGQVATNSTFNNGSFTGFHQANCRSHHFARGNITPSTGMAPVWTNWYANGSAEATVGAATTLTATIEYPAATFTRINFTTLGITSNSGTIADGGFLQADPISITIPNGASFWFWTWETNTAGISWGSVPQDVINGERCQLSASGQTDQTNGGTITNNNGASVVRPASIPGLTVLPSVFTIGDSIDSGFNDSYSDGQGLVGVVARSVGQSFGYVNGGVNGDEAVNFLNSHAKRIAAVNGAFSAIIDEYGDNDFRAGRTAAQLEANQQSIAALFPSVPFYLTTLTPVSNSTDGWSAPGNQTVASFYAQWVLYNDWVRSGSHSWAAGYFEIANPVSTTQDSGLWPTLGNTTLDTIDGLHPNPNGNYAIRDSGNIPASTFARTNWLLNRDIRHDNDNSPVGIDLAA